MGRADETRLIAWGNEMRAAHERLRRALAVARETIESGDDPSRIESDLLLYCNGFCTALSGHHRGEDRELFVVLARRHPELVPVIEKLKQDHSMIEYLLGDLAHALHGEPSRETLDRHLDGIDAIMESHFRYEERELLGVLETLDYEADPQQVFGPL